MPEKRARGFAAMDVEQQRRIARMGGRAAHERGTAHEWNSREAAEAGRKGGKAAHHRGASGGDGAVELAQPGRPGSRPEEADGSVRNGHLPAVQPQAHASQEVPGQAMGITSDGRSAIDSTTREPQWSETA